MVDNDYIPSRGDVVWLDFDPQTGHEQKGRRPALVVSIKNIETILTDGKIIKIIPSFVSEIGKGGMTEIGVNEINKNIPMIFNDIFEKTLQRYEDKKKEMNDIFAL